MDLATLREAEPPVTFAQFVDAADLWGAAVRKVRGLPQEGGTMALGEQEEVEEGREQTQNVLVVEAEDSRNIESSTLGSDQHTSKSFYV